MRAIGVKAMAASLLPTVVLRTKPRATEQMAVKTSV
jgi:hypothetical protein